MQPDANAYVRLELAGLFQTLRGVALMPVYPERSSDHLLPSNANDGLSIDQVSDYDRCLHAYVRPKRYESEPQSFVDTPNEGGSVTVRLTMDSNRVSISPSQITFSETVGHWLDLYGKMTITALDDELDEGNQDVRIS